VIGAGAAVSGGIKRADRCDRAKGGHCCEDGWLGSAAQPPAALAGRSLALPWLSPAGTRSWCKTPCFVCWCVVGTYGACTSKLLHLAIYSAGKTTTNCMRNELSHGEPAESDRDHRPIHRPLPSAAPRGTAAAAGAQYSQSPLRDTRRHVTRVPFAVAQTPVLRAAPGRSKAADVAAWLGRPGRASSLWWQALGPN
jgi:hypothetical protein